MGSVGSSNEIVRVGLTGEESDRFMEQYHNKQLIGSKVANTMDGLTANKINKPLRNGEMPTDEAAIKLMNRLDKAIQKNKLPQDMTLFRGVDVVSFKNTFPEVANVLKDVSYRSNENEVLSALKPLVGEEITDKGFMMTSASSERSIFIFSQIGMEIQASSGQNVYISNYKEESELILPRGTKLKITGVRLGKRRANNGNEHTTVRLITKIVKE